MDTLTFETFPPITRTYLIVSIVTNILCFLNFIKPMDLILNFECIFYHYNIWRLFSHIFFFGQVGIKAIFFILFFSRYSKALESSSFQGNSLVYFYFLFTGNSMMILLKLFVPEASYLGPGITFMVIYIWGKKNAQQQINLINLFYIRGSSLPLVLMLASWFMKQKTLKLDIMGIIAGHIYYFLEEIYPRINGGQKVLIPLS